MISFIASSWLVLGIVLSLGQGGGASFTPGIVPINWLIIATFIFKLGLWPFHQLTADLYDHLPTRLTVLIQVPIKLGLFLFILQTIGKGDSCLISTAYWLIIACIGILGPAIATMYAYNFKRFIALSSSAYAAAC